MVSEREPQITSDAGVLDNTITKDLIFARAQNYFTRKLHLCLSSYSINALSEQYQRLYGAIKEF